MDELRSHSGVRALLELGPDLSHCPSRASVSAAFAFRFDPSGGSRGGGLDQHGPHQGTELFPVVDDEPVQDIALAVVPGEQDFGHPFRLFPTQLRERSGREQPLLLAPSAVQASPRQGVDEHPADRVELFDPAREEQRVLLLEECVGHALRDIGPLRVVRVTMGERAREPASRFQGKVRVRQPGPEPGAESVLPGLQSPRNDPQLLRAGRRQVVEQAGRGLLIVRGDGQAGPQAKVRGAGPGHARSGSPRPITALAPGRTAAGCRGAWPTRRRGDCSTNELASCCRRPLSTHRAAAPRAVAASAIRNPVRAMRAEYLLAAALIIRRCGADQPFFSVRSRIVAHSPSEGR